MTKRLLQLMVIIAAAATANAQSWYKYTLFSDKVDKLVESEAKVYYLADGCLFSYNPGDSESYAYTAINTLSDNHISNIYYNPQKKYLLIAYQTGNIDLLYDNGKVVNLPEIKDSRVSDTRNINDVAFGRDRIAVATSFGVVIYSDERHEVIESTILGHDVNSVAIMGDYLLIYAHYYNDSSMNFTIRYSPLTARHNNIDKFDRLFSSGINKMVVIDDSHLLYRENNNNVLMRKVNFNNGSATTSTIDLGRPVIKADLRENADGVYSYDNDALYTFSADGITRTELPAEIKGNPISYYSNADKLWVGTSAGVARYDVSGGAANVEIASVKPADYITTSLPALFSWSADGERLYITRNDVSAYHRYSTTESANNNYQQTNIISGDRIVDASLKVASGAHSLSQKYQTDTDKRMYGSPTMVLEDLDDPDKYYCGSYFEGLYVIKRNKTTGEYEEIGKFTEANSPLTNTWGVRVMDLKYDREGNLWVGEQFGNKLSVLPAAKRRQDPSTITTADWITLSYLEPEFEINKDLRMVICQKSNMIFVVSGRYEGGLLAIDTKGTYTNPKDDKYVVLEKFTDQDGNEISFTRYSSLIEDSRGCVWVGTDKGIFEITNPSKACDMDFTIRRIKVPRNDGTNYADYLLESEMVYDIATDPSDRKWVATEASGLYLVSKTGDALLKHYDRENSPLPENMISAVTCNPGDNTVYVGTRFGLYSFKSDSSPGQVDYSNIYAYPNPVRPEYSGLVSITGLMDNSVVKITDANGNLVFETRSEGGMATWNVCNLGGERVKSGVYHVFVSSNNSGTTSGSVAKILVIN